MWNHFVPDSLGKLSSQFRMNSSRLFSVLVCLIFSLIASQLDFANAKEATTAPAPAPRPQTTAATNATNHGAAGAGNKTSSGSNDGSGYGNLSDVVYDNNMLRRSFYVLIGCTIIALMFFTFKWLSSKRKRKTKKYGVLASHSSDMELRPLDDEDDEEDMTVFDVNSK